MFCIFAYPHKILEKYSYTERYGKRKSSRTKREEEAEESGSKAIAFSNEKSPRGRGLFVAWILEASKGHDCPNCVGN
jgi:hypothetical protein